MFYFPTSLLVRFCIFSRNDICTILLNQEVVCAEGPLLVRLFQVQHFMQHCEKNSKVVGERISKKGILARVRAHLPSPPILGSPEFQWTHCTYHFLGQQVGTNVNESKGMMDVMLFFKTYRQQQGITIILKTSSRLTCNLFLKN